MNCVVPSQVHFSTGVCQMSGWRRQLVRTATRGSRQGKKTPSASPVRRAHAAWLGAPGVRAESQREQPGERPPEWAPLTQTVLAAVMSASRRPEHLGSPPPGRSSLETGLSLCTRWVVSLPPSNGVGELQQADPAPAPMGTSETLPIRSVTCWGAKGTDNLPLHGG
ncbi:hypothetical protein HJG60_010406 [Phyllostomus discolor]|uniref:Uncharacterized protein n=1 Tax=Phyllostomus discolor TaxID=89673 RepID=A0A834B2R4_9CHIR|nr:hypothetical protein HJG60_010406 [Phyllostomus discolor]